MYFRSMKRELVFFFGFCIGFTATLLVVSIVNHNYRRTSDHVDVPLRFGNGVFRSILKNEKLVDRLTKQSYNNVDYSKEEQGIKNMKWKYETWLANNNVTLSTIDMDLNIYGPTSHQLTESQWLKSKINIICVVSVDKIILAKSIKNTWGQRCNKIYFFSKEVEDGSVPIVKPSVNITSSWQMLCEVMNSVWKMANDELQWVIFVKDDTMVLTENLRYLIAPIDYNKGYYLGHPVVLWGQPYNVAQAGYVLSRGAFQKIIETFDTHEKCISGGKYWKNEDYYLAKHLAQFNIYPSDTRDNYMRGIFHGYSLPILLWGVAKKSNYFNKALYPPGRDCCSSRSVTFTVAESSAVHTMNYMIYHLHVYNSKGRYGNMPAPTPVPENEIWKLALKEEFNLTDVDNISNERFYDIWRLRYSEPSQFIKKNNQSLPKNA